MNKKNSVFSINTKGKLETDEVRKKMEVCFESTDRFFEKSRHLKNITMIVKEIQDHSVALANAEANLGYALTQFSSEVVSETEQSKDLKQLCTVFSDKLKKLSFLRSSVNGKLENDLVGKANELLNEPQLKDLRAKQYIGAEADYQTARRDFEFSKALAVSCYSYLCYFETTAAMFRDVETLTKQVDRKVVEPQKLHRETYYAECEKNQAQFMQSLTSPRASSNNLSQLYANSPISATQLFKVPLKDVFARPEEVGPAPLAIEDLIQYIENHGITKEGLFRVPGSQNEVVRLKAEIDSGKRLNIEAENLINKEHTIAGLIKQYFRDLPDPLLTNARFEDFCATAKITDPKEQLLRLKQLVTSLPVENYYLLGRILELFQKITEQSATTKMNSSNISISFGLNLLRSDDDDPRKLAVNMASIHRVIELLITHVNLFYTYPLGTPFEKDANGNYYTTVPGSDVEITIEDIEAVMGGDHNSSSTTLGVWQEYFDQAEGKPYYYNPITKETTWDHPSTITRRKSADITNSMSEDTASVTSETKMEEGPTSAASSASTPVITPTLSFRQQSTVSKFLQKRSETKGNDSLYD